MRQTRKMRLEKPTSRIAPRRCGCPQAAAAKTQRVTKNAPPIAAILPIGPPYLTFVRKAKLCDESPLGSLGRGTPHSTSSFAYSIFNFFHIASTFAFTSGAILSIGGHARVNPSAAHFRVASIPIFDP